MRNELGHHSSMYILFLGYDRSLQIAYDTEVGMHINMPVNNVCKQTELFQSCLALVVALHQRAQLKNRKHIQPLISNINFDLFS